MAKGGLHIGTSGWHYDHWRERFYPEDLKSDERLAYYARHFATVEINNTFYKLPTKKTLAAWRDGTPSGFLFACKASRFITHMKKLKDPEQAFTRFFDAVATLEPKLGPILFQLPPRWRVNAGRLAAFLETLPSGRRYAFEFRDETWFTPEVLDLLAEHGAALCAYDIAGRRSPIEVTADFVYVRLHGPGAAYEGSYDGRTLRGWQRRFDRWAADGKDVYCYFDNDQKAYAVGDALRLLEMSRDG